MQKCLAGCRKASYPGGIGSPVESSGLEGLQTGVVPGIHCWLVGTWVEAGN